MHTSLLHVNDAPKASRLNPAARIDDDPCLTIAIVVGQFRFFPLSSIHLHKRCWHSRSSATHTKSVSSQQAMCNLQNSVHYPYYNPMRGRPHCFRMYDTTHRTHIPHTAHTNLFFFLFFFCRIVLFFGGYHMLIAQKSKTLVVESFTQPGAKQLTLRHLQATMICTACRDRAVETGKEEDKRS